MRLPSRRAFFIFTLALLARPSRSVRNPRNPASHAPRTAGPICRACGTSRN